MADPAQTFSPKQRLLLAVLPPVMGLAVRALARSWRVVERIDPASHPLSGQRPLIYAMWHENVLTVTGHWRDHAVQGLASQSFDGELIAEVMGCLGYPPPSRGSSSRGGVGGLLAHVEALRAGRHVAVTVDGPRGPAYRAKPGVLRMAEETGASVVPVACRTRPAWRLKSWDRTQVPPPCAKVVFALGAPLPAAGLAGDNGLEVLHRAMAAVHKEAEALLVGETV